MSLVMGDVLCRATARAVRGGKSCEVESRQERRRHDRCEHVGSCTFDSIWLKADPGFLCVIVGRPNLEACACRTATNGAAVSSVLDIVEVVS
jgi:hypothetical protein